MPSKIIDARQTAKALREPTLISFVDMARWLAAMMVMLAHARNPLIIGYGELAAGDQRPWVQAWFWLTGFHAQAVLVFFVLSGFLVGGLSMARAADGRFESGGYAIDRIARLFIAFLPALALTFGLDWIGVHYFGGTGLYDGTHPMVIAKSHGLAFQDLLSGGVVLGNITMLQYYFTPVLGSNQPLWTLSTEFWFYMVFGLCLTGAIARGRTRYVSLALALVAVAALGGMFVSYLGQWLVGLAVAMIYAPRLSRPVSATIALVLWLAICRFQDAAIDADLALRMTTEYVTAILFGWVLLSMRGRRIVVFEWLAPFNKFMADFSYSLYLVHFPVLIFATAVLGSVTNIAGYREGFRPTDPVGIASYVGIIILILAVAWLFAQLTERHTADLRRYLRQRFHQAKGRTPHIAPE
ncbi:MAG: peptidoglycan/LPS O-acetylase OafA/YrhL [Brevundimonas sp.]|jgi:peptidoglycan/LPS O-acetylase OafA/YrhL|uniref:acyltransferase family protein n=1 Tax=Brevundimonas sp. TaxID=1871086 RepID=UPI002486D933|nr:acyltransferase [Brevundimonas sp.]MDI1282436.1 acyltransferase [Brevundimonas sp.]